MTEGAQIIPFRPRTSLTRRRVETSQQYVVKGAYERHRRRFSFTATSDADAIDHGTTLLTWYAYNSGPYTELVWQRGEITLSRFSPDEVVVAQLTAGPKPLTAVPSTKRKKKQ